MKITLNQIVKPMERGQVTIPINIRKKLGIGPQTWLWMRLVDEDKILIEPVEKNGGSNSLLAFLGKMASDSKIYWQKKDSQALTAVRKKSLQRIRKLHQ